MGTIGLLCPHNPNTVPRNELGLPLSTSDICNRYIDTAAVRNMQKPNTAVSNLFFLTMLIIETNIEKKEELLDKAQLVVMDLHVQ